MKRFFLVLTILQLALLTSAQTFSSNQISMFQLYERIDFYDAEGGAIVSIAPRFYRHKELKQRIKPIKVGDQSYFIKIEKFGVQSVYTASGEHVADMERDGSEIRLLQDDSTYALRPRLKFLNANILECYNSEGILVSKTSWNNDKKLSYDSNKDQNPNLLLMALCAHQYQELLLGDRGRLTNGNYLNTLSILCLLK